MVVVMMMTTMTMIDDDDDDDNDITNAVRSTQSEALQARHPPPSRSAPAARPPPSRAQGAGPLGTRTGTLGAPCGSWALGLGRFGFIHFGLDDMSWMRHLVLGVETVA